MKFIGNLEYALQSLKSTKQAALEATPKTQKLLITAPNQLPRSSYAQSNTVFTQPQFYSPMQTAQNWQIPIHRKNIYMWCRYFYENEPKIAAAIDFYCFPPSTPVLMSDGGEKAISEIIVGDLVRSHDGSINRVVRKYERMAKEPMLKIKIGGINRGPLKCTLGHKLLVERDGKIEFLQAGQTKVGDFLLTPINYDLESTSKIDNDLAWLIGAYAAEGCCIPYEWTSIKGKKRTDAIGVYFTISADEKYTFGAMIRERIQRLYGEDSDVSDPEGSCRIAARGSDISDDLCGLCPGMSKNGSKRFSPVVMNLCHENLKHVLAGFMSGDGCYNKNNGFQGVGVSKKLCEQIASICEKLGLEYSISRTVLAEQRQTCYNIRISRSSCCILEGLTHKLYSCDIDSRYSNYKPYFKKGNFIYRQIRRIDQVEYEGKVFDLEIENSHSYVVNRISCHNSQFAITNFETQCDHFIIKKYFDNLNKKLNMNYWLKMISKEYYTLGDAFPFLEIECPLCHGGGVNRQGKPCHHPGGTFRRIVVLNPDTIEVQTNILADTPLITLKPDNELRNIVWHKEPKHIYDRLPMSVRQLILAGQPIPLANECITHLKHNPYPYTTYGTSIIRRLFKTLAYKDKLMTAQWIVAERLILPIRVVKVGSEERPAGPSDLADIQGQLAQVANEPNLTLVTHHNIDYEWYGANGKIMQLSNEYEQIDKEILQGLMINDALLSGSMGAYQSAAIGAEAMIQRMEAHRLELARYVEDRIYKPIAQMRGFINEQESKEVGEPQWLYPKIHWDDLNIRDDTQQKTLLNQLHDKGVISTETLLEKYNLDNDQEIIRLRHESVAQKVAASAAAGGAPGGGGGAPPMAPGGGGAGAPPEMGAGGAPGGVPGGEMGASSIPAGGAPGGAPPAPAGAAAASMGGSSGKILAKGRKPLQSQEAPSETAAQPAGVRLTSLEQNMFMAIEGMKLPFDVGVQYSIGPYAADFAIPMLNIDIEVDGEYWHNQPETKAKDAIRDQTLVAAGWTVLRFGEAEIKDQIEEVKKTIGAYVHKRWKSLLQQQEAQRQQTSSKKAAVENMLAQYGIKEEETSIAPNIISASKTEEPKDSTEGKNDDSPNT